MLIPFTVTTSPHSHSHADHDDEERMQQSRYLRLASFLESHFGEAEIYLPDPDNKDTKDLSEEERDDPAIIVKVDDLVARVNLVDLVWLTIHFHFRYPILIALTGRLEQE
jgi:hypothetical protein